MLPFLKNKTVAGLIISKRKPDEDTNPTPSEVQDDPEAGLKACMKDLIDAVHAKDESKGAAALRAAFEIMEASPHEEAGENEGDSE